MPGVYLMFDASNKHLYIGKANNLVKRLSSYFAKNNQNTKTIKLVSKIAHIETIITANETASLLLEQTLIKQHLPPYNILLRDDKSYPYVLISNDKFPRLSFYRGSLKKGGNYFGPYPSSQSVREALSLLKKSFLVRTCSNAYFNNRSRACLQYQIKRCSAPCVNLISEQDYQQDIYYAKMFLTGKNQELTQTLAAQMEQAAQKLEFEQAAKLRDKIAIIRRIQDQQVITNTKANIDILAVVQELDIACVHVLSIRSGVILGGRNFFPQFKPPLDLAEILYGFMAQYYLTANNANLPKEIIANIEHSDFALLETAFKQQHDKTLIISCNVRSERAKWQQLALTNAQSALNIKLESKQLLSSRFSELAQALNFLVIPKRIECFDISHSSGEATIASCVVFGINGAQKEDYRRYNISGITAGDDYAAMAQALHKRFAKHQNLPDLLLIDGGIGQLNIALEVLASLQISLHVLGIAKGPTRKAGLETLFLNDEKNIIKLESNNKALHLIQQIRDEAHRFAITGHRAKRDKTRRTSQLEQIAGIGAKRRRELLKHFGGLNQLKKASLDEIAKVDGISKNLAANIYAALHN